MAATYESFSIPSFDLDISDDEDLSQLIVEDSLVKYGEMDTNDDSEVLSQLIVKDSLDIDGEIGTDDDNGDEDVQSIGNLKHNFDFNKVPGENVFDLNEVPSERVSFEYANEEIKKEVEDMANIYINPAFL
ncbi:hypothetical protein L195_g055288 [Trifolium pratense]|uniref:Uncharacterized protein n=1 Tax=Trifolium pratense TaxID=57577 RepID=A0A2K3KKK6_TRIPR|nr:hypothetical protein L195_g055288 [Trifolium pratense]